MSQTKRILADHLKELMMELPFEQITVTMLCEKCGINRKSFYYHFRDKYDVVNWIFDTEYREFVDIEVPMTAMARLDLCSKYLYRNREFYAKALEMTGQNSFSEHFREKVSGLIRKYYIETVDISTMTDFQLNFFTDAIAMAFHRWLCEKDCMSPEEFMQQLMQCAAFINREYEMNLI